MLIPNSRIGSESQTATSRRGEAPVNRADKEGIMQRKFVVLFAILFVCACGENGGDNSNPVGSNEGFLTGQYTCTQQGGVVTATDNKGDTVTCAKACLPAKGCDDVAGDTETMRAALTGGTVLDGNINPMMDCSGTCGPINLVWCGDAQLANGTPYTNRWLCMANLESDGSCHMHGVPMACDENETCEIIGSYPTYGVCQVIPTCTATIECDDGDPCTMDDCSEGTCQNTPTPGAVCDDGFACTTGDSCRVKGPTDPTLACMGDALVCDDANECTVDACNQADGKCTHNPLANNTPCDDKDKCTNNDVCTTGVCGGTDLDCDDTNECTVDACNATTGACAHNSVPDTTACDDGDVCTLDDNCQAGKCTGTAKSCDDQNPCTSDTCDPETGECEFTPLDDGEVCAVDKVCVNETCIDEALVCKVEGARECQQDGGELFYKVCVFAPSGTMGAWAVTNDCGPIQSAVCTDAGGCIVHTPCTPTSCHDTNECTQDSCNVTTGECEFVSIHGTSCNDGNQCTEDDECKDGVLGECAGTTVNCDDFNPCTQDSCDMATGCTNTAIAGCKACATDAGCDDANAATQDKCVQGACQNTPVPQCTKDADCPTGQFCGAGYCYDMVDQHGRTGTGQSGVNGGPLPDGTPDNRDDDGDCYCETLPCLYTTAATSVCPTLFGGDCDDTATGFYNHPGAVDYVGDNYDNNCDGTIL